MIVAAASCRRACRIATIGQTPRIAQALFRSLRAHSAAPAWNHFWGPVLALAVSHGSTIDRLPKKLRGSTHRANLREFLWRNVWDQSAVMQQIRRTFGGRRAAKTVAPAF